MAIQNLCVRRQRLQHTRKSVFLGDEGQVVDTLSRDVVDLQLAAHIVRLGSFILRGDSLLLVCIQRRTSLALCRRVVCIALVDELSRVVGVRGHTRLAGVGGRSGFGHCQRGRRWVVRGGRQVAVDAGVWLRGLTQQRRQLDTLVCACLMDEHDLLAVRVDLCVAAANAANTHHAVYFEASDWALAA